MIRYAASFFKQASPSTTRPSIKALLSLLVGASVALLCAQASAIEISSMSVSPIEAHVLDGDGSSIQVNLNTDVGFAYVKWYVEGNLVATHTGDGTGTSDSLSNYAYAGLGSTTGNMVTVKAIAYRNASNTDDHATGYAYVTVWTQPEQAITSSMSRNGDMGPGLPYSFTITLTPPNKHYSIDGASVEVDGQTAQAEFDKKEDGSVALSVAGSLPMSVGGTVTVKATLTGGLWDFAKKHGKKFGVTGVLVALYNGVKIVNDWRVRGHVKGLVKCATAHVFLGTHEVKTDTGYTFKNECRVSSWIEGSGGGRKDVKFADTDSWEGIFPWYKFEDVACGREISVQVLGAKNYHDHAGNGKKVAVYYPANNAIPVGKIGATSFIGMTPGHYHGSGIWVHPAILLVAAPRR